MSVVQAVRAANRPGPPEHSIALRVGAAGAVGVAVLACWSQGELGPSFAASTLALVAAGSVFSYRRRQRPFPYLKLLLAAVMLGAFAWFFVAVSSDASVGDISSVEGPLATLFAAMQAAHAFDVPARRDLGFSLAGSATLMAVAAAQAVDLRFGALVAVWAAFVVTGLVAGWGSMAGGARVRPGGAVAAAVAVIVIASLLLAILPAPRPAGGLVAPSSVGLGGQQATQPSRLVPAQRRGAALAASASGPTGVGGFLGFAGPLDTAVRASLGDEVVLEVRADRPTYWIAETFDSWSGQSWTETTPRGTRAWQEVGGGSPFVVPSAVQGSDNSRGAADAGDVPGAQGPPTAGAPGAGAPAGTHSAPSLDYQTFYLATAGSDLVLHAARASAVWFPSRRIYVSHDGTIKAGTSLGAGSIYTVLSSVESPSAAELRSASGTAGLSAGTLAADLQLPHAYPRVAALASRITAGLSSTYAKVSALERWIGAHTRYTTDIPPLRPGQDTVESFLFGSRRGYCEQISTALAVMLRTLGIPAREATGYVPGPYDPLTDLYEVQAKDAHAWVQVWFPGYGWESFDPTASVPLANPSPGQAIGHDIAAAIGAVPIVPTVPVAALALAVVAALAWRRRRPATWRSAVTRHLERAAVRAGVPVGPGDTLETIADCLDATLGGRLRTPAAEVARLAEVAAWRGTDPEPTAARTLVRSARRIRRTASIVALVPGRGGRRRGSVAPSGPRRVPGPRAAGPRLRSARGGSGPRPSSRRPPGAGGTP